MKLEEPNSNSGEKTLNWMESSFPSLKPGKWILDLNSLGTDQAHHLVKICDSARPPYHPLSAGRV
ncbi:MAG: hypothetical protein DMG05_00595 [Acidobacteria bacterium]|nr:MAG: hypothetical protein DMG05_00595 [Acidobacteriota bacterium]